MPDRMAFVIPRELRQRADAVIEALRRDAADREARDEFIAVVEELTETGLDYYFLLPLERAGAGMLSRSTAQVGVAAAKQGIPRVIRRVVRSMPEEQLLAIVAFLDEILIREEGGPGP